MVAMMVINAVTPRSASDNMTRWEDGALCPEELRGESQGKQRASWLTEWSLEQIELFIQETRKFQDEPLELAGEWSVPFPTP